MGEGSLGENTACLPPVQVPWTEVDLVTQSCLIPNPSVWGLEVPGNQMGRGLTTMRQSPFLLSCIASVVQS